jgi:hypothetical protein
MISARLVTGRARVGSLDSERLMSSVNRSQWCFAGNDRTVDRQEQANGPRLVVPALAWKGILEGQARETTSATTLSNALRSSHTSWTRSLVEREGLRRNSDSDRNSAGTNLARGIYTLGGTDLNVTFRELSYFRHCIPINARRAFKFLLALLATRQGPNFTCQVQRIWKLS